MKSDAPNPTIGLTYNGRPRTWGFRFSILDGFVLAVAFLVSYLGFKSTNGLSLLLLFVVLHFFLFCNVFRIRRKPELIWAATFVANCIFWTVTGNVDLIPISLCQLPITVLLIVLELRLPCYHGVLARRINARLEDYLAGRV